MNKKLSYNGPEIKLQVKGGVLPHITLLFQTKQYIRYAAFARGFYTTGIVVEAACLQKNFIFIFLEALGRFFKS